MEGYMTGVKIVGGTASVLIFIGSWIYCMATYGFLLGVGLGWFPSVIVAVIAGGIIGWCWPLVLIGALALMSH